MSPLFNKIKQLCEDNNISIEEMCRRINIDRGHLVTITKDDHNRKIQLSMVQILSIFKKFSLFFNENEEYFTNMWIDEINKDIETRVCVCR
jgi:transcriptional regulator with XRE-family HTH domain